MHTPTKRECEAVAYQGSKMAKTSIMLIFEDKQDIPLICSDPLESNQNDAFNLVTKVQQ
jgi:hypothetical protein